MKEIHLPYEVWEVILHFLDGISIMSLSCTSRTHNAICQTFFNAKKQEYWRLNCLREFGERDIQLCQSGLLVLIIDIRGGQ